MLPVTKGVVRFTPLAERELPNATTYLLGVPTVAGRAQLRRMIAAAGMRHWVPDQFTAGARAFIEEHKPENQAELLAVIDGFVEVMRTEGDFRGELAAAEALAEDDPRRQAALGKAEKRLAAAKEWSDLLEVLQAQSEKIAGMFGDNLHYSQLAPYVTAGLFLRGWENLPFKFRQLADGSVPFDLLDQLPEGHLVEIWLEIAPMLTPTRDQEKNSVPPSGADSTRMLSSAASDHRTAADGTSAENSTS